MKRLATIFLVTTTVLACTRVPSGWAQPNAADASKDQPAQQPAASNTRWAECVIEVSRETGLPNLDELSTFVDNTAGQLAPTTIGVPRDQVPKFFTLQTETRGGEMKLTLTVDLPVHEGNTRPAAREYLDRIVRDLLTYLENTRTTSIDKRTKTMRDNVAQAEQKLQATTVETRNLEKKLREVSGRINVAPQNLMDAINQLDEEHMKLQIEQAAKLARRTALTKALADSKKDVEERVREDPVVAELEKIVGIRTEALKRKREMAEQGVLSKEDLAEAEAELSQVRAQLLERRQEAAERAGAGIISSWNHELLSLSVDENEMLARLEQVAARLEKMHTLLDSLNQLEDLQRRGEDAQRMVRDAEQRLQDMAERLQELAARADTSIVQSSSMKQSPTTQEDGKD